MKNQSFGTQLLSGLLLAAVTLGLASCSQVIYRDPAYPFANRSIPPSGLLQRVLASYTVNGSTGGLEILDGLRDIRSNVQNTIPFFGISGYSGGNPTTILSFPEIAAGFVYSSSDGGLTGISYGKESSIGGVGSFGPNSPSIAAAADGSRFFGAAEQVGQLLIIGTSGTYRMNLPNVYKVAVNRGNTVILAMVRNSNALYRIVKLNQSTNPPIPPGSVDCQPLQLPVYCVVPVAGTYDRPSDVYFSLDGSVAYVLNCGPECGGTTAGITFLQEGALTVDNIPTVNPLSAGAPSPLQPLPAGVTNPIPIPGGVTEVLSDGTTLYVAGQSQLTQATSGSPLITDTVNPTLFTGYLSLLNLNTFTVSNPVSISDGSHSKMLFADDSTLWVGSQQCANGKRSVTGRNINCLTRIGLPSTLPTAASVTSTVIPANVVPGGLMQVPYPNSNQNLYYYGSLTGLCWVQQYHKMYTAYGGQIHAFNTVDGSEINNTNITIQGTVLDVAYMDALTNSAD